MVSGNGFAKCDYYAILLAALSVCILTYANEANSTNVYVTKIHPRQLWTMHQRDFFHRCNHFQHTDGIYCSAFARYAHMFYHLNDSQYFCIDFRLEWHAMDGRPRAVENVNIYTAIPVQTYLWPVTPGTIARVSVDYSWRWLTLVISFFFSPYVSVISMIFTASAKENNMKCHKAH